MQSTWDWAIPCWGKVAVARGKRGLGKVANVDWHEISAYAIKNETIRSGSKNSKICHLSSASRPSNPVKHLRQRQGATGDTWSGNIAPRMADGSSSRGPHPARPGYMCCRACTAESTAPRSTVRFKLIPEGPCAKAGARYEGAPPVHGPHANSRWLCDNHQQAAKRSASKSEAVIVDIIPPSALPADRFCTVCARTLALDLAAARQEVAALNRVLNRRYPPTDRPQDAAALVAGKRLTHHGVVPLAGHGPGNTNPDHRTVFFLRALR